MQDTRAEQTYRSLKERILAGDYPSGTQLVTRSLAQELGVSLAPIREAIHRLAVEGVIDHVPGAGAFVRTFSRDDLNELYILRAAIESCAAGEAARYISQADLEELTEICDAEEALVRQMQQALSGVRSVARREKWIELEERFHEILVDAARNKLLKKVISEHRAQARIFDIQRHFPDVLTPEVAEQVVAEHRGLVEALTQRDSPLASQLMEQHIQAGRRKVMSTLRSSREG